MNDTQTRLLINPIAKTIVPKYRNQKAVYVAKGDHKSVSVIFELPRYVDGHDLSEAEYIIQIHFVNLSEDGKNYSKGISEAISREIEGDNLSFAWLVDNRATRYAGVVSVSITIEKYASVDGKAEEVYSWSTAPYGNTKVWDSYDNSSSMTEQEYDYLVATVNTLVTLSLQNKLTDIDEIINNKITNAGTIIDSKTAEAKTEIDDKLINAKAEIDNGVQLTARYAQESEGNVLLAKDQVVLAQSWAVGGTGARDGEDRDNAKYYSTEAKELRDDTVEKALEAESWASGGTGTREDEDTDNAMYYCVEAMKHATSSKNSAEDARVSARDVVVIKNDAWQYRTDAEAFAQQSKEYAESNMLKGKASGVNAVRIDDVSPLEHNVEVITDIDTVVMTYGKNLIKYNKEVNRGDWVKIKTSSGSDRYVYELTLPNVSHKMTISLGDALAGTIRLEWSVDGGTTWNNDGNMVSSDIYNPKKAFDRILNAKYRIWATVGGADSITNIQVELGGTATEFEKYKEPIKGATWVYPTATVIADTPGTNIEVTYNRDLNKVIAEIYNAIANL